MRRRWRYYATGRGRHPVREFLDALPSDDRATVLGALRIVRQVGLHAARHVEGDVYEVRVAIPDRIIRVLFAQEGRRGQVLLALSGFVKKTRKTPREEVAIALARLRDWRARARRRV